MKPIAGEKPRLEYIDIKLFNIDKSYQRSLGGRQSQKRIRDIAENFDWSVFGVLNVVKHGNKYNVIDGQHRLMGAIMRRDIKELPCCIISVAKPEHEAKSFVGINRDRVRMHVIDIFHAGLTGGNKEDAEIVSICGEAGVTICRTATSTDLMPPNHTQAIGVLRRAFKVSSRAAMVRGLKAIARAFPDTKGQLRAKLVMAVIHLYSINLKAGKTIDDIRMSEIIGNNDPIDLERFARDNKAEFRNNPWLGIVNALARQYNKGIAPNKFLMTGDV